MLKRFLYIPFKSFFLNSPRHCKAPLIVIARSAATRQSLIKAPEWQEITTSPSAPRDDSKGGAAPRDDSESFSKPIHLKWVYTAFFVCFTLCFAVKANSNLSIQVSIKPIHSIAAFICQGAVEPGLLMTGQESPHTQALTPQQLQALKQADLVIWIGPEYEAHWQNPLHQQVKPEKILSLIHSPQLTLYPYRQQSLAHAEHEHEHHNHSHEVHSHSSNDGHIWLDINNAKVIAYTIAQALIKLDPSHQEIYKKNLSIFLDQLAILENDLKQLLAPIKGKTYLIYHDGLQYLDRHYGLQTAVSLVIEPGYPPNAQDLLRLRSWLTTTPPEQRPSCIFTEPGFDTALAQNLATEFNLKYYVVDYIGYRTPAGPQAYFSMMRQLAADLLKGLS